MEPSALIQGSSLNDTGSSPQIQGHNHSVSHLHAKKRALKFKARALSFFIVTTFFLYCAVEHASLGLIEQFEEMETTNVKSIIGNHPVKIP